MIAPARQAAYRILLQIATTDAHSDDLLRERGVDALSAQDRNLVTALVLGTLRWQLALDARIRGLLARPNARLSPEAAAALQMGAYQLLHLDRVPAHAVIHDSVELVKQSRERGAAGLVNAVLRKMGETAGQGLSAAQAAVLAHPAWMVERWARRFGEAIAERICWWDQEPAAATLRIEPNIELSDIETEPGAFLACARRVLRGDAGRSAAVRTGQARIQDEASQLVAEIAAASARGAQARKVLDTCAAPGGKTAILLERLPHAQVTAVDVSAKRVLAARAERFAGENVGRIQWEITDAAKLDLQPEWDRILCDVPCSGTGTMARNPEIRLRVTEADLMRQQTRQIAILRAALPGLAPGGRLVYSTCSLEPEENEDVIAAVLRQAPGISLIPIAKILDELAATGVITAEGRDRLRSATQGDFLRTIPGVHPCDGFFAAVLERRQQAS
ncbi:MAG: transcription antitermination factor NusB [Acidobacteriaceae bacterium]